MLSRVISASRINVNVARRPHAEVQASSTSRLFELAAAGARDRLESVQRHRAMVRARERIATWSERGRGSRGVPRAPGRSRSRGGARPAGHESGSSRSTRSPKGPAACSTSSVSARRVRHRRRDSVQRVGLARSALGHSCRRRARRRRARDRPLRLVEHGPAGRGVRAASSRRSAAHAHAIAVANGTAALHLAPAGRRLRAWRRGGPPVAQLRRRGERDRAHRGRAGLLRHRRRRTSSTSIPADVEAAVDPADEGDRRRCTTPAIRATWTPSRELAERRGLRVVEDAAHAPGASLARPHVRHARRRRLLQLLLEQEPARRRGRHDRHRRRRARRAACGCCGRTG